MAETVQIFILLGHWGWIFTTLPKLQSLVAYTLLLKILFCPKHFFPLKKDFPKPFPQLSACTCSVSALCLWFSETSHFTSSIILYDYLELSGGKVREIVFQMMKRTGIRKFTFYSQFWCSSRPDIPWMKRRCDFRGLRMLFFILLSSWLVWPMPICSLSLGLKAFLLALTSSLSILCLNSLSSFSSCCFNRILSWPEKLTWGEFYLAHKSGLKSIPLKVKAARSWKQIVSSQRVESNKSMLTLVQLFSLLHSSGLQCSEWSYPQWMDIPT